jgi:ribosomal protein L11 methyltransferase
MLTVEVTVCPDMEEAVSNFFHERAPGGLVLDEPNPGLTRVTAYVPKKDWPNVRRELEATLASLAELFPACPVPVVTTSPLRQENWAIAWRDHFKPIQVGRRLIVTPPWIKLKPRGRQVIIIEPAEAFGTGTHETTQGCLVLLEEAIEQLQRAQADITMLDVGCGSGILAIAGAKLGVSRAFGVDNDIVAVESALRNVRLNKVEDRVRLECVSVDQLTGSWDIVTANLDPLTLQRYRDHLVQLFTRFLIISGVPSDQWASNKGLFEDANLSLMKEIVMSEWGCGLFGR